MSKNKILAQICAVGILIATGSVCDAQTFRWRDENGVIHYGDTVPAKYKDQAQVELSREGVPLKRTERALTADERKALEDKRAADTLEAEKREAVDRLDRALMSKYANPRELQAAHNRELERVDDELAAFTARANDLSARTMELLKLSRHSRDQKNQLLQLQNDLLQSTEILERKLVERSNVESRQRLEKTRFVELLGRTPTTVGTPKK